MKDKDLRVRFAPAPTGMMHLGNVRTALMNFLMARQQGGTFILRIEDTDQERNFDPRGIKIREDLAWLGIDYDEGPDKEGKCGPYLQSERDSIYQEKLQELIKTENVYRCFCTTEELDKKRERQIALKLPPRYDRTCLKLSAQEADTKAKTTPFIWRVKLDHTQTLIISDLSHGAVKFELKNFTDFPITRQDGSVTFMFANFVDDVTMKISCVIRGEDHLSNTAGQAALYQMLGAQTPRFWHLPILCTKEGKKLSKRDFGFSLRDLKDAGFLPQAINNYLAIIGASFPNEIMSQEELLHAIDFGAISSSTRIKYDVDKLRWVNHKWICLLPLAELTALCRPYLESVYSSVKQTDDTTLQALIKHVQTELITLQDSITLLAFCFEKPLYEADIARTLVKPEAFEALITVARSLLTCTTTEQLITTLQTGSKTNDIGTKAGFSFIRYALIGQPSGIGVGELIPIIGLPEAQARIKALVDLF